MKINQVKLGKYKHYKGDMVEVIGKALHSETMEEFVIYKHVTGKRAKERHYWARPFKMFLGKVKVTYHNPKRKDTFGPGTPKCKKIKFRDKTGELIELSSDTIPSPYAQQVRSRQILQLDLYL